MEKKKVLSGKVSVSKAECFLMSLFNSYPKCKNSTYEKNVRFFRNSLVLYLYEMLGKKALKL